MALTESTQAQTLQSCEFIALSEKEVLQGFAQGIATANLRGAPCRLVLNHWEYRLLQMAHPEVPDLEVREALRWRIQEMIDFPAEQAELEFFPMPETRQSGRGAMLNVAVCETQVIRRYVDFCKQLGLDLQVIDIPELCLRNLAAQFPENERGVALLYLNDSHGILIIEKSAAIYVTRDLEVSSVQVEAALASEDDFQAGGIVDRLALEIQRSMDYYESYYGMPPIASLVVAPLATNTQVLVDQLNQRLGVMARAMDVSALLHCPNRLEDAVQQRCLPVLGALLREAEAA